MACFVVPLDGFVDADSRVCIANPDPHLGIIQNDIILVANYVYGTRATGNFL